MAQISPAGAVVGAAEPKPEDLREYDAILTAASRLTFRLKTVFSGKLAVSTFHVDADTN